MSMLKQCYACSTEDENSEVDASELLGNLEEMFLCYW